MENVTRVEIRVRYAESDQMGVAYYGTYPTWFEVARTEYCRERGVDYREVERGGVGLVVAEMWLRYKRPVHYDDLLVVTTWVKDPGQKAVTFCYKIHKDGKLCTEGYTKHVFVDIINKKPVAAPEELTTGLYGLPRASNTI